MDRALKERIIGAAVLVVFVVLVVPIFLDGPPQEGEVVSERVLLPGQEDQETKTVVLERERSVPIPAASSNQEQRPAVPEPAIEQPVAEAAAENTVAQTANPEVEATPEPDVEQAAESSPPVVASTASTTGMWAVQLGSFSSKDNAEGLADRLRRQGYAAFVSQVSTANGTMHRVRIGPQKDRPSAEQMATRLGRVGHQGQVVPHP